MGVKTRGHHKNQPLLPFPGQETGNAKDAASLERRQKVVAAVRDFYRGQKRRSKK